MDDRYFINRYHKNKSGMFTAWYMIMFGILLLFLYGIDIMTLAVWIIIYILTRLTVIWIHRWSKCGLHIEKDYMYYYDSILIKKIYYDEVKGIKIIRAKTGGKNSTYARNETGGFLYSILLLKYVDKNMEKFDIGDDSFCMKFPKSVLSKTIYKPELLDYIKEKNPDVVIMSDMR